LPDQRRLALKTDNQQHKTGTKRRGATERRILCSNRPGKRRRALRTRARRPVTAPMRSFCPFCASWY